MLRLWNDRRRTKTIFWPRYVFFLHFGTRFVCSLSVLRILSIVACLSCKGYVFATPPTCRMLLCHAVAACWVTSIIVLTLLSQGSSSLCQHMNRSKAQKINLSTFVAVSQDWHNGKIHMMVWSLRLASSTKEQIEWEFTYRSGILISLPCLKPCQRL